MLPQNMFQGPHGALTRVSCQSVSCKRAGDPPARNQSKGGAAWPQRPGQKAHWTKGPQKRQSSFCESDVPASRRIRTVLYTVLVCKQDSAAIALANVKHFVNAYTSLIVSKETLSWEGCAAARLRLCGVWRSCSGPCPGRRQGIRSSMRTRCASQASEQLRVTIHQSVDLTRGGISASSWSRFARHSWACMLYTHALSAQHCPFLLCGEVHAALLQFCGAAIVSDAVQVKSRLPDNRIATKGPGPMGAHPRALRRHRRCGSWTSRRSCRPWCSV